MKTFLIILALLPWGVSASASCTKHNPCLSINFNPVVSPQWPDTTPAGTAIATITVTLTPSGTFTGSLGFGSPYGNDGGLFAISGSDLVLAASLPSGSSTQHVTVTATQ